MSPHAAEKKKVVGFIIFTMIRWSLRTWILISVGHENEAQGNDYECAAEKTPRETCSSSAHASHKLIKSQATTRSTLRATATPAPHKVEHDLSNYDTQLMMTVPSVQALQVVYA